MKNHYVPEMTHSFKAVPIEIPIKFFPEIEFIWKEKGCRIGRVLLETPQYLTLNYITEPRDKDSMARTQKLTCRSMEQNEVSQNNPPQLQL